MTAPPAVAGPVPAAAAPRPAPAQPIKIKLKGRIMLLGNPPSQPPLPVDREPLAVPLLPRPPSQVAGPAQQAPLAVPSPTVLHHVRPAPVRAQNPRIGLTILPALLLRRTVLGLIRHPRWRRARPRQRRRSAFVASPRHSRQSPRPRHRVSHRRHDRLITRSCVRSASPRCTSVIARCASITSRRCTPCTPSSSSRARVSFGRSRVHLRAL